MTEFDKNNLINTNVPRDSYVYADGDFVIKMPATKVPAHIKVWLEGQKYARDVIDNKLNNRSESGYFIPKIVEISESEKPYIREERVSGRPITKEYFFALSPMQQDIIYKSLAQFICDMNQSAPVLDIINQIESNTGNKLPFLDLLKSLKSVLTNKEMDTINKSYELLKQHPERTSSFVFFHGDMNEHNIFFDEKTNKVSFIDFTETRYVSAHYMFYSDLVKLPWLDIKKLIELYNDLPKKAPVRTNQDKTFIDLFDKLRAVQTTGESMLARPQNMNIFKRILQENIAAMGKSYQAAVNSVMIINSSGNSR